MTITIKCDQMPDGWNYDTCVFCKHFISSRTPGKGTKISCKLNKGGAAEKRTFEYIWNENYLIGCGVMDETRRSTIIVDYVGRKKKGRKTDDFTNDKRGS